MIAKLYELMFSIGIKTHQDKVLHFVAGLLVGAISHIFIVDSILVLAPVILVAVGKELYDKYIKKTYFDFFDMFATLVGGWIGIMITGLLGA